MEKATAALLRQAKKGTPMGDLREDLKDPEYAAYFANAQAESAKELLKCGVITALDSSSLSNKTSRSRWRRKL